jgi:hypothetical protein
VKPEEPKLLTNAIRTPDGTILESRGRHDYRTYTDANGKTYMVDGGLDYQRRNLHRDAPYIEISVDTSDPHGVIRECFTWGTYGINGDQPIKYVALKDLEVSHIEAILETQSQLREHMRQMFKDELVYRSNL